MLNWVGYVFSVIGPIVIGILYDKERIRFHTVITVILTLFLSSITLWIGYKNSSAKMFLLAQTLLGLTGFSTLSLSLEIVCEEKTRLKNKVGYISALFFYIQIGLLLMYVFGHVFAFTWGPYILFNLAMVLFVAVSFTYLYLTQNNEKSDEDRD